VTGATLVGGGFGVGDLNAVGGSTALARHTRWGGFSSFADTPLWGIGDGGGRAALKRQWMLSCFLPSSTFGEVLMAQRVTGWRAMVRAVRW